MAVLFDIVGRAIGSDSKPAVVSVLLFSFVFLAIVFNALHQILFKDPKKPPLVFHWVPFFGNAVAFGKDPLKFYTECQEKHGNIFTFILLGQKLTVYLGTEGNHSILDGDRHTINAEDIYGPLTSPVFGKGVVYDCPNEKLMDQKRLIKSALTTEALDSYVQGVTDETRDFFKTYPAFVSKSEGVFNVTATTAELTILTASRCLQGPEVRKGMSGKVALLFAALDKGFTPLNFVAPNAPIERNRGRDRARNELIDFYGSIIKRRREAIANGTVKKTSHDVIWDLMDSKYKDGRPIPDSEIACMMIALLMAGQHSSASTSAWILLRLADDAHEDKKVHLADQLLAEQKRVLGEELRDPTREDLDKLELHTWFVKETLRLHAPIHSVMRKVKKGGLVLEGKTIPKGHVLVSALGFPSRMKEFFKDPLRWDPHRWDEQNEYYKADRKDAVDEKDDEVTDYGYGRVHKGTRSPYLPFGAGRHRCIGENFAFLQLRAILVQFVRAMEIRNATGKHGIVGTDYSSLFSHPLDHAEVSFRMRDAASDKS